MKPGNAPEALDRFQSLLLRAALCNCTQAIDAWMQCDELPAPNKMDHASQWLFPLLYRNLIAQGVCEDRLLVYRSVYRHNWYKNILFLDCLKHIASELNQQATKFLVFGSAALTLAFYRDMGVRPISSLDFVCPRDAINSLAPVLDKLGWYPDHPPGSYKDGLGRQVLLKPVEEIEGEGIFDRKKSFRFKGERIPLLDHTTHSRLILSLNRTWDPSSSLLWMADIVTMFGSVEARTQLFVEMPEFKPHLALIDAVLAADG